MVWWFNKDTAKLGVAYYIAWGWHCRFSLLESRESSSDDFVKEDLKEAGEQNLKAKASSMWGIMSKLLKFCLEHAHCRVPLLNYIPLQHFPQHWSSRTLVYVMELNTTLKLKLFDFALLMSFALFMCWLPNMNIQQHNEICMGNCQLPNLYSVNSLFSCFEAISPI